MPHIQTGKVNTWYEFRGSGKTIVFLHGGTIDHNVWDPQIQEFSKTNRVLTYDLRGHGKSSGADEVYSIDSYTKDLKTLLDKLEVDKPVLCGLSFGGTIALNFAFTYPDRISHLILTDALIGGRSSEIQKKIPIAGRRVVSKTLGWFLSSDVLTKFGYKSARFNKRALDLVLKGHKLFKKEEYPKLVSAVLDMDLRNTLLHIKVPVLVLYGQYETFLFPSIKLMKKRMKGARFVKVPKTYHVSNLENEQFFNETVKDFLRV